LGLSRMDAGDGQNSGPHFSPFEQEVFEGKGDYQFDIYRMMRKHNEDKWAEFHSLTNVMWLHYLSVKLLKSKNIKPPSVASRKSQIARSPLSNSVERTCYTCLAEIEKLLGLAVQPRKASRGRLTVTQHFKSALDVVDYGRLRNWINNILLSSNFSPSF